MTDKTEAQPEALRLAEFFESLTKSSHRWWDGVPVHEKAATVLRDQATEIERLRALAATCYAGLGGECDLPVEWLDALNNAANGEPFDTDGLLPYASAIRAQLITQTNRAAAAEQQVTAFTQRLDMANRLNTDARNQLALANDAAAKGDLSRANAGGMELRIAELEAQLSARQAAPDGWDPIWAVFRTRPDENGGKEFLHYAMWHNDTILSEGERYVHGHFVPGAAPPPPEREPLSQHDLERLVGNWFSEGWAKKAAFGMLDDYELTRNRSHQ